MVVCSAGTASLNGFTGAAGVFAAGVVKVTPARGPAELCTTGGPGARTTAQCHDEGVHRSRERHATPVAITAVAPSLDDQHDARRRKYLIMMGLRVVCVIAAASVFRVSILLALGFMLAGAVLPWCAVLIANDRPARNRTAFVGYRSTSSSRQLPRQGQAGPAGTDLPPWTGDRRAAPIEWLDPDEDN